MKTILVGKIRTILRIQNHIKRYLRNRSAGIQNLRTLPCELLKSLFGVKGELMFKNDEDKLFFRKFFIEQKKYEIISKEMNIPLSIIRKKYGEIKKEYSDHFEYTKRLRQNIYNQKKNTFKDKFKFKDFPSLYDWCISKEEKCFYCRTEQYKIRELVQEGEKLNPLGIYSSQMINRGLNLELERKNSQTNEYSEANCELVCYFCNNDKSNVISGDDYEKYFKNTGALKYRKKYIDKKYNELIKSRQNL